MATTTTPPTAGRSALRILKAKSVLVAECGCLGIPLQRPSWQRTIDLAIPKWGVYAKALWNDYVDALLELAGVDAIPGVKKNSQASAVEWLTRPIGERAALVMAAWAREGWSESPAGSNHVNELDAVARRVGLSSWYAAMGWAWCDFSAHLAGLVVGSQACAAGVGAKHAYNGLYTVESLEVSDASRYGWKPVAKPAARLGCKFGSTSRAARRAASTTPGGCSASPARRASARHPPRTRSSPRRATRRAKARRAARATAGASLSARAPSA